MRSRVIPVAALALLLGVPAGWAATGFAVPEPSPEPVAAWVQTTTPPQPSASPSASSPSGAAATGPAPSYSTILADAPVVGGATMHATVLDAATGSVLADRQGSAPIPPASTLKVISAAAILRQLSAAKTLTTSVSQGAAPGELVLSGSGDVLLGAGESDPASVNGRAGLGTLAKTAAAQLVQAGPRASYSLAVDGSNRPEPLNPAWPDGDIATGEITAVSPLAVNSAYPTASRNPKDMKGGRQANPLRSAAGIFARALEAELAALGHPAVVAVSGGTAGAVKAVPGTSAPSTSAPGTTAPGKPLASVESAPVGDQLEYALLYSDNYVIESLARTAAVDAGQPATSAGVKDFITAALPELTQYPADVTIVDACGLSGDNRVTARAMASVVRTLVTSDKPDLRAEASRFPIAGLSGTLESRFAAEGQALGRGVVRGKTGTLNATAMLAGYTMGPDGRLIVFTVGYTGVEGYLPQFKSGIDTVTSRFASGA